MKHKSIKFDTFYKQLCLHFVNMAKRPTKYVHDEKVITFLSTRIRNIREEKGITQEELANEAEIGLAQLKRIELGLVNTSISSLYRIANALDLTLGELFGKFR